MTRKERLELNELSKKVYGTSSKWTKLLNRGQLTTLEEKMEDGTTRKYKGYHRFELEELKEIMLEELADKEKKAKEKAEKELAKQKEQDGTTTENTNT